MDCQVKARISQFLLLVWNKSFLCGTHRHGLYSCKAKIKKTRKINKMRRSWSDSFAILVSSFESEKCVTFIFFSWQSRKSIKTMYLSDQVAKHHHSTQKKFSLKRLFRIKGQSTTHSTPDRTVNDELRKDDEYLNFRILFSDHKIIIFYVKEKLTKIALMFNWNNTVRNRGFYV